MANDKIELVALDTEGGVLSSIYFKKENKDRLDIINAAYTRLFQEVLQNVAISQSVNQRTTSFSRIQLKENS